MYTGYISLQASSGLAWLGQFRDCSTERINSHRILSNTQQTRRAQSHGPNSPFTVAAQGSLLDPVISRSESSQQVKLNSTKFQTTQKASPPIPNAKF